VLQGLGVSPPPDRESGVFVGVGADWQARDDLRLRGSLGLLHTEISQFSSAMAAIASAICRLNR